jgi:hypothetical protein
VLIFREARVVPDGILEHGVLGTYMPEVDLDGTLMLTSAERLGHT